MIGAHLASSSLMNCAVRSGVVSGVGMEAIALEELDGGGVGHQLARLALSSVSITSFGMPAGPRIRLNV